MKWSNTLRTGFMLVVSFLMLICTARVYAQAGNQDVSPPKDGGFIERLDRNNDGKVSRNEFDGPDEHFDHMDKNSDGFIDKNEAPKEPPPGQGGAGFVERFDKNNDGKVSEAEFDGPSEHFDHMDQNGDGYIDESEVPKGPPPGAPQGGGPRE